MDVRCRGYPPYCLSYLVTDADRPLEASNLIIKHVPMTLYSQRDPRWATTLIGPSKLIVGRWGCTLTSISMLTSYFTPTINPGELADIRSPHALKFTKDGLILWQSCTFQNFHFVTRGYGRNEPMIREYLKDPNKAVILEVNHCHWVVAVGRNPITGKYKIADPWFGDYANINRYGDNITGSAYFAKHTI